MAVEGFDTKFTVYTQLLLNCTMIGDSGMRNLQTFLARDAITCVYVFYSWLICDSSVSWL